VTGGTEISFTTTATDDPYLEPVDCLKLLDSYRKGGISQLRDHTDELPYHKSYVRLTNTQVPFYLSTSDANVDKYRVGIFTSGGYYEMVMTSTMQTILKGVSARMNARNRKERPIMIDVGGNVGWFSMLAAAHGAEVFVFEPNVVNMVRLCESSVLNGWSMSPDPAYNQVHPYLKGASDTHGSQEVMYKVDPGNPGSFSFSKETADNYALKFGKVDTIENRLQLVTLDALARDQHWLDNDDNTTIAILKIDVEGLELKVLSGARKLLKAHKVQYIFLEWKIDQVNNWEAMSTILLESGYVLYKFGAGEGPNEVVTTKFLNGKELAMGIESIRKERRNVNWENMNVLFRLAEIEGNE
jgi:FkbM family methyltransferase